MSAGETGLQLRQPFAAGFAAQADTDQAYRAMIDAGTALAWTAIDAAVNPRLNEHLLRKDLA